MNGRFLGRCVTFNGSYAFLRLAGNGGQKDVFAGVEELPGGTISVGDKATFDVKPDPSNPKRFRATNIRLIDGEPKVQKQVTRAGGMYAKRETYGQLAEGLRKFLRSHGEQAD